MIKEDRALFPLKTKLKKLNTNLLNSKFERLGKTPRKICE
jgi:hypothetical protein